MSGKRCPEAVRQIIDRSHSIASVATRLDITTHNLYVRAKKYGPDSSAIKTQSDSQSEIRRLQKKLKRVTDKREMQKKAAADGRKNATEQAKAFYAAYLTAFFNNSYDAALDRNSYRYYLDLP